MVIAHEEHYFIVYLHGLIYHMCLKYLLSVHVHVVSHACHLLNLAALQGQLGVIQSCTKRLSSKLKGVSNVTNKILQ